MQPSSSGIKVRIIIFLSFAGIPDFGNGFDIRIVNIAVTVEIVIQRLPGFADRKIRRSKVNHRAAEEVIEYFWKILKSVFKIKSMQLQGDGLYAALLIKVISYLLAIRLKGRKAFSKYTIIQIIRKIRSEYDLKKFINEHFHQTNSTT